MTSDEPKQTGAPGGPQAAPAARRVRRRWPWVLAIAIVGAGALAGTLFLPPVQRSIVLRLFPAGPEASLELQGVHVGPWKAHVRGLRLDWRGLKLAVDEAEARYGLFGLLATGTARLDRLTVRGLVVDVRSVDFAWPWTAMEPGTTLTFEGLRPFARLPVRGVLAEVDVDAELLTPAPNGGTARLHAILTGRGIAPGATGELDAQTVLRLEGAGAARDVLVGRGTLRVHESDEGVLDTFQYRGEVRPADPNARRGAGLAAQVAVDLTAADESYRAVVSTTGAAARDVVEVGVARRAADGHLAGSWKAHLDAGQVGPYLGESVPPEFALDGTGTFEFDLAAWTAAAASRFVVAASGWERLHPGLASIGALQIDAEVAADVASGRVEVRSLWAKVAPRGAPAVLEIGADQPFRFDGEARRLEPSRWGAPLAHLRLENLPAAWQGGAGTDVEPFAGTLSGALELVADDPHRIRLRSTAPLELAGLRLHTPARDLGPLSARADIAATVTADRIEATLADCRVELADTSRLAFGGSLAMPRDGRLVATLKGDLAAHVVPLSGIVPEIDAVRAGGTFGLDLRAATLSLAAATLSVDDGSGWKMVEGSVSTVRPLVVDVPALTPRWTEFEPASLRLRVDGFPIAWVSRYVPQIRIESGTLHGNLSATVAPDRSVRIAADAPFEVRETNLFWGDLAVLTGARLEVSPSIVLSRTAIEAELNQIAFRDAPGNRFEGTVRVRTAPHRGAGGAFTADFRTSVPSLTRRVGNLGDFELHAAGSVDAAAKALKLTSASFDCKDTDGRSYLSGTSLQPFTVGLAKFEVTPGGDSVDLFRATFVPIEIEKLFPEALGFAFSGPLPSGDAVISASEGGLLLHAPKPLEFGPVTVTRNGAPFLDRVRFTFLPDVAYTPKGIRSRETLIGISSAGRPIANIATRGVFDIVGLEPERTVETTVEALLPALFDQPVGQGFPGFDRGRLDVSWRRNRGPSASVAMRVALSDVARRDGLVAPDLDVRANLDQEADGDIRIEAPVRLTTPARTSDVLAHGRLRPGEDGNTLELAVESERIVIEDVALLARTFLPRDADSEAAASGPPASAPPAPEPAASEPEGTLQERGVARAQTLLTRFGPQDGRALWDRLHGRIPIRFKSIEFDRYAVENAQATLESTSAKLAVEEFGARFLGAHLGGRAAVTFDGSGAPPYGVEASLEIADIDLGRIFTAVDPSRKPTLEGRFRLDAGFRGAGADPVLALIELAGEVRAEGKEGVFRGLGPEAKTASTLVRAAGALTFSKALRAVGRLIGDLQELPVHEARLRLERDPARGLVLDALDLRSDDLLVHSTGSIRRERGLPLVEREIRLDMNLAATGDAAIVFDGMGLLGKQTDERGFCALTRSFSVGGTVGAPDQSDLWTTLDEAAAHAKGSFGWALRKAMKIAKEQQSAP